MTSKAIFIPYFGKFNEFFKIFLSSCSYNHDYTFFIFTNDKTDFDYPSNCNVKYIEFEDFRKIIQEHFDFKISLKRPYKICDFRPCFGDVFADLIKDFDYWGFCDVDVVLGKLSDFYTDELLLKFDRISDSGHFSLFKNNSIMRKAYKMYSKKSYYYKEVFCNDGTFAFDEWGMNKGFNRLLIENGFKIFYNPILFSDIRIDKYGLRTTREVYDLPESAKKERAKKHIIFSFENGVLLQHFLNKGKAYFSPESYLHLQKRSMVIKTQSLSKFVIVPPNIICDYPNKIDEAFLKQIKEKFFYFNYLKIRYHNFLKKIKNKCK